MPVKIIFVEFSDQQASTRNDQITELNCFLHYYSRFKNHENSYKVNCFFIVQVHKISMLPPQKGLKFPGGGEGFCNTKNIQEMYKV